MIIKAEELSLRYGDHKALSSMNFELPSKKIYGLLGRNGAGKTSLLSILASFRQPTTGAITVNGEIPFENHNITQNIVFMYNNDYKDESENIQSMLKYVPRYRPNFDLEYAEHLITRFKLDKKKPIKELSKGMQSALNVTIGLASRAPITLLDEVYLGMDAPSRDIFYKELLEDHQNHPRTIILSTHLVSEMDYLFEEVIIINNGRLILHEDITSLLEKGATITGNAELVDAFVRSKKLLHTEKLGNTKAAMIYGELSQHERNDALIKGLELAPLSLQELFIHLTEEDK